MSFRASIVKNRALVCSAALALALALTLTLGLASTGCFVWGGGDHSNPISANANSVFVFNGDVYMAGETWGYRGTNSYSPQALLWKNGPVGFRSDLPYSRASSVFVADNDVYVAGAAKSPDNYGQSAVIWKNGAVQYLPKHLPNVNFHEPLATSVYVSGTDVYVAGYEFKGMYGEPYYQSYAAMLWKNGEAQRLADEGLGSIASSVFVSGSDVYVAGNVGNMAVLWKNGGCQYLTDSSLSANASSVYVSGGDVYVAGHEGAMAMLWKNGVKQSLTDASPENSGKALSVFVLGEDVYVAGEVRGNLAALWKNNVRQNLTENADKASANSVFVSGGDVYVAGEENSEARLWKNGAVVRLPCV
jgi:hypothetical protein